MPTKIHYAFHTLFQDNDIVRAPYRPIPDLMSKGIINSLIGSTLQERRDLISAFDLSSNQVKTIPVSYADKVQQVDFTDRDPNKIILISRISEEKNVDDAIEAVFKKWFNLLRKLLPILSFKKLLMKLKTSNSMEAMIPSKHLKYKNIKQT